jgi:DNA-binding MarR family transcriptional regulator
VFRTIIVGVEPTKTPIRAGELAAQLRVAVWRAARRMRHVSDVEISPTLHAALGTVERHGPITAGQLARHEHVRKPTMTRTIRELVDRGLIERLPDPLDGRITWLKATPAGKSLLHNARRRTDVYLTKGLQKLSAEERETLQRAAKILERLAERGEER